MPDLRARSTEQEQMDTGCADADEYAQCLRDLTRVNVLTRTHAPVLAWLAREAQGLETFTVCDIGCGEGDLLRAIARRFPGAVLTGVDRHPWSIRAARAATPVALPITHEQADLFALGDDRRWDFIVSSQFTHHLTDQELVRFIRWQEEHARRGWFVADLHRHWFAWHGFPLLARVMRWHRFVRLDGQVSIARAFTMREWADVLARAGVLASGVRVRWHMPFRICVARRCVP